MPGILDYKKYLNTLQTLNEIGNLFPTDQKTLTYYVGSPGTTQGWTATISWMTLIIDRVSSFSANGLPDVTNSQILGFYTGGSTTQYSTGTISLPTLMYTGPILPASLVNIPLTVVNVSWVKNGQTYDVNFGFVQNWTPGVRIGDPYGGFDFEPLYPDLSTLTLTGTTSRLSGQPIELWATSDIPLDINSQTCYIYLSNDLSTPVSTATFVDKTAQFSITTTLGQFSSGTYNLRAGFGGIQQYSTVYSNTLTVTVIPSVPLLVDHQTLSPSTSTYSVSETINYELEVYQDPNYAPVGLPISSAVSIFLRPFWQSTTNDYPVFIGSFTNGLSTGSIQVIEPMISETATGTAITIQSFTYDSIFYYPVVKYQNTTSIQAIWDYDFATGYGGGSTSTQTQIAKINTETITIGAFSLDIQGSESITLFDQKWDLIISYDTADYAADITVTASRTGEPDVILFQGRDNSTTTITTSTQGLLSTGTWTIIGTFPGDYGQSHTYANRVSVSGILTHEIVSGNLLGNMILTAWRTETHDVLNLYASATIDLIRPVTFLSSSTVLGTSTFVRAVAGYNTQTSQLLLPRNSIQFNTSTIHATWPGTLDLPPQYGLFYPVDIYLSAPPVEFSLNYGTVSTPLGGEVLISTSTVYSTNPVRFNLSVTANPYQFPLEYSTVTAQLSSTGIGSGYSGNYQGYTPPSTYTPTFYQARLDQRAFTFTNNICNIDLYSQDLVLYDQDPNYGFITRPAQTSTVTLSISVLVNGLTSTQTATSLTAVIYDPRVNVQRYDLPYTQGYFTGTTFIPGQWTQVLTGPGYIRTYLDIARNMNTLTNQAVTTNIVGYNSVDSARGLNYQVEFPGIGERVINTFPSMSRDQYKIPIDQSLVYGSPSYYCNGYLRGSTSDNITPNLSSGTVVIKGSIQIQMPFAVVGSTSTLAGYQIYGANSSTVALTLKYSIFHKARFGYPSPSQPSVDSFNWADGSSWPGQSGTPIDYNQSLYLPFPNETLMNQGATALALAPQYFTISHDSKTPNIITINIDTTTVRNIAGNGQYGLPRPQQWYRGYEYVTPNDPNIIPGPGEEYWGNVYFFYRQRSNLGYTVLDFSDNNWDDLNITLSVNEDGYTTNSQLPTQPFQPGQSLVPALPLGSRFIITSLLYLDKRP